MTRLQISATEPPNQRQQTERLLRRRLEVLNRRHRREAERLLGDPPNPENIPAEFWIRVEQEHAATLVVIISLLYFSRIETSFGLRRDSTLSPDAGGGSVRDRGLMYARARSDQVARQHVQTARRRLERTRQRADELEQRGEPITDPEIRDRMAREGFGRQRSTLIARNETTKTRFEADKTGALSRWGPNGNNGGGAIWLWVLGPCRHCKFCPMIAGTDVTCWSEFTEGPPAHHMCCCSVSFGPPGSVSLPCPDPARVRQAAIESWVFQVTPTRF